MELKPHVLIWAFVSLASCQWFDPVVTESDAMIRPYAFVNVDLDLDSVHCSFSQSGPLHEVGLDEGVMEACVRIALDLDETFETCATGPDNALGMWVPSIGAAGAGPGDTLKLLATTDKWNDFTSTAIIPHAPQCAGMTLSVRSMTEGNKTFDEIDVVLSQAEGERKWHLLQLLMQVDTVGAGPPEFRDLRTDDEDALVRRHGGSKLDNALLVDDEAWDNNVRPLRFRVRNKLDEGVPYHYLLMIQSISEELHAFYTDLELLRREDGMVVSGNVDGADGCFGVTHSSIHLLFP